MSAPDDIEHANARMLDAFRQANALRLKLAEVERERDAAEAESVEYYADRDRFKHERDEERAHVARLVREVQEMAARRDEAIARAERAEAERDAARDREIRHVREIAEARAERDDAAKARDMPGGRDPGVRLPVVPATCGECEHAFVEATGGRRCAHRKTAPVCGLLPLTPPDGIAVWCPLRPEALPFPAELAKAGGL